MISQGLENGMAFPSFSEYQDTFSSILSPASFAAYSVPQWIPTPSRLVSIARIIYQYWKERRIKRGGHRIIPIVNVGFDMAAIAGHSDPTLARRKRYTQRIVRLFSGARNQNLSENARFPSDIFGEAHSTTG